jgi:hydroxymethylbilane synthase
MKGRELVIGTRGSALAIAQTEIAISALRLADPSIAIRIERIKTTGDIRADLPLSQLGHGVFVSEIENALREGRIDIAVHSAKDLPSTLDESFTVGAFLLRADARDVLVSPGFTLATLPPGSRVGTSSPRRACLLRATRPDLDLRDIRGNVDTRLRKLVAGEFDAIVLAGAGLLRLNLEYQATEWLDVDTMIPCVGQGALALEARAGDGNILRLLGMVDHGPTRMAVTAERAFLAELGAGCQAAAGAHAEFTDNGTMRFTAFIGDSTGRHVRTSRLADAESPEELGGSVAGELIQKGGGTFLARKESALAGKCIAITRPSGQEQELSALLRANGAVPIRCPTIAIESLPESSELDTLALKTVDWVVFTSINAVRAVADQLDKCGAILPQSLRLAVAGSATARALEERIRAADFIAPRSNADALAKNLPVVANESVVFFRGDLARDALATTLTARGAVVREIVVYRTVPGDGATRLTSGLKANEFDAVVFGSPSSIRFSGDALELLRLRVDRRPLIICIGSTTSEAAESLGITADCVAAMQTVGGIVESLERAFLVNLSPAISTH